MKHTIVIILLTIFAFTNKNNDFKSFYKISNFTPGIVQAVELDIGGAAKSADVPGTADYDPTNGEAGFGKLISRVLNIAITIGALLVFLNLVWGGITWITSGGDKSKVETARNRITQSVIGLIVLASAVAVFTLVQGFLGLEVFTFS